MPDPAAADDCDLARQLAATDRPWNGIETDLARMLLARLADDLGASRRRCEGLASRVSQQSELLTRAAERSV